MHVELIGGLEKGDAVPFQLVIVGIELANTPHFFKLGVAAIKLIGLIEAHGDQAIISEKADVTIMVDENAIGVFGRLQKIFAEKEALVRAAKESKNRGGDIERTAESGNALGRFDDSGAGDEERNFIGMDRDILAAIDPRAVICDDDKNCVGVEGLFARRGKESTQSVIRILDGIVSFSLGGIFRDASARIGIRHVVRN